MLKNSDHKFLPSKRVLCVDFKLLLRDGNLLDPFSVLFTRDLMRRFRIELVSSETESAILHGEINYNVLPHNSTCSFPPDRLFLEEYIRITNPVFVFIKKTFPSRCGWNKGLYDFSRIREFDNSAEFTDFLSMNGMTK